MASNPRVAVIGAGASGLAALRLLVEDKDTTVVCFEGKDHVGGTWVYSDDIGKDQYGRPVQSSMYKNLRTNFPKEIMEYPGFRYPKSMPSYISHRDVAKYLHDYAEAFGLLERIRFLTEVRNIKPLSKTDEQGSEQWEVQSKRFPDGSERTEVFDSVFVCNGHYTTPRVPKIKGLDKFRGKVLHSHDYRVPEVFSGQRVVCVGGAISGREIAVDLCSSAKEVFLSLEKARIIVALPVEIKVISSIREFTEANFVAADESTLEVDVVIMCTGYKYTFPFLSADCQTEIREDSFVYPLYKQVIHCHYSSLFFIGLCKNLSPNPHSHSQAMLALRVLKKEVALPSEEAMMEDVEEEIDSVVQKGLPVRHVFYLKGRQWKYDDAISGLAGRPGIPNSVRKLFKCACERVVKDFLTFRDHNYEMIGNDDFKEVNI